jgi:chromosome segregation ATPase
MSTESDRADVEGRPPAEVDRIRDIIFGPQMRLYEQQFKRLVGQLEQTNKQLDELRSALDQQRVDQEARTRQAEEEMRQRHAELEQAFSDRLGQLEANLDQRASQLTADLRKQGQDLRSEFTTALDALDDDKAGRHDVGDLLVEMGTRIKERVGVADLLGQLTELAGDQAAE